MSTSAIGSQKPYIVCTFDGGGVKAIGELAFLSRLEQAVEEKLRIKQPSRVFAIGDAIDAVAGSSAGSFIAAAIVRSKGSAFAIEQNGRVVEKASGAISTENVSNAHMTARRAYTLFQERARDVFSGCCPSLALCSPKYSSGGLKSVVQEFVGENTLLSEMPVPTMITFQCTSPTDDPGLADNDGVTFPPARDIESTPDFADAVTTPNPELKVWEMVMCSAAAPGTFAGRRGYFNGRLFTVIDGGAFAVNPSYIALQRLKKIVDPSRLLVLSFGAGSARNILPEESRFWGVLRWATQFVPIQFNSSVASTHDTMKREMPEGRYVRWQFEIPKALDKSDDFRVIPALEEIAAAKVREMEGEIQRIATIMATNIDP